MNYYNYFTEIEDTFIRRRGKNLFLSPLDWAMIEAWQDQGIPLHIVIRSIESVFDVFDQQPPGTRSIKSLLYCREEVEAQYHEWLQARTGAGSDSEETEPVLGLSLESIGAHIDGAIAQLREANAPGIEDSIERVVERLTQLRSDLTMNLESVDGTLGDIEKILDTALLSDWDKAHLNLLSKEVGAQLKAYKSEMDKESYQNTFNLMLLKRLREHARIPRLGLYYL